jgi:3-hydroxyacyl-[acyl-carrier-protein] dehydratase
MRWIWIDRFLTFESGKSARAVRTLSLAEVFFGQHFPGYPVMPACFILEGLAQTGGILVGEANEFREKVVLAKITSARFHREAMAGETLIYDVEMTTLRPEGASIAGKVFALPAGVPATALTGEKPLAEADIFFAHLDQSRSQQMFGDHNFVFSGELKNLLQLAKNAAARPKGDQKH